MSAGVAAYGPVSTADVRDAVRDARAGGTALRIRGAGTWMAAGAPVDGARELSLGGVSGIVDYVPGDLTLTARAGTPLAEIARTTAAERQWLALDPFGDPNGTLGATVATASAGPIAAAFGSPRDAVLGIEVVTGTGAVVHGGGRVVKNVAGFDLCRLFTGSWGTLGVVTEVTVRLRALPEGDQTVALALETEASLGATVRRVRDARIAPIAVHLLSPELCAALGLDRRTRIVTRLAGNEDSLAAQRAALKSIGELEDMPGTIWTALAAIEPLEAVVLRLSRAPSRLPNVWMTTQRAATMVPGTMVHACAVRGIARIIIPTADRTRLDGALGVLSDTPHVVAAERLPREWWPRLRPPRVDTPLNQRARAAFDPNRIMNPGVLGDTA